MKDQQKLNELYLQFQVLAQQATQLEQTYELIEGQLVELNILEQSVEEIKESGLNSNILVPLGSGIFLKASLKDNNEVIMNVGSNTLVKKDIKSCKEIIRKQITELNDLLVKTSGDIEELSQKMRYIQETIENSSE